MSGISLVYGWYNHDNLGDQLFIEAFKKLFPELRFVFTDAITADKLNNIDAVFFGGGSFLDSQPEIDPFCLSLLVSKPIFYISVGAETDIHPHHQHLMSKAKLIAIRTPRELAKIEEINPNTIVIPDIVYSLNQPLLTKTPNSILVLPNITVVPCWGDPYWQHLSWQRFKLEFAQTLDTLTDLGNTVHFASLCTSFEQNDTNAAIELINHTKNKQSKLVNIGTTSEQAINLISQYELVITQRYHGMVLSELSQTPYIAIHHHDKLRSSYLNAGSFLSYFSCAKEELINAICAEKTPILPIPEHIFETLKEGVQQLLKG